MSQARLTRSELGAEIFLFWKFESKQKMAFQQLTRLFGMNECERDENMMSELSR
jgi:hypothetical protein